MDRSYLFLFNFSYEVLYMSVSVEDILEAEEDIESFQNRLDSDFNILSERGPFRSLSSSQVLVYTFEIEGNYNAIAVEYEGDEIVDTRSYNSRNHALEEEIPDSVQMKVPDNP